jgi:hypothetical protein
MREKQKVTKKMVSAQEAAIMYSISAGTLGNWRSSKKTGPKYFKVNRKILYKVEDLETFFTATPVLTRDSLSEEMQ